MLGVHDDEIGLAAEKLAAAGLVRQNWPFSSTVDPATRKEDAEMYERAHARIRPAFANFDARTMRFHYPDGGKQTQRTVLIPSSYIRLEAPPTPPSPAYISSRGDSSQPTFYVEGNLHYPNAVVLLESIITVYLEERELTEVGNWKATLEGWAIGYLYGELSLRDDVLDTCGHEGVKEYFNMEIKRGAGIPRVREKWGRPRELITNERIAEFQ